MSEGEGGAECLVIDDNLKTDIPMWLDDFDEALEDYDDATQEQDHRNSFFIIQDPGYCPQYNLERDLQSSLCLCAMDNKSLQTAENPNHKE